MISTTAQRSPINPQAWPQHWRYSGLLLALGAWFLLSLALSLTTLYSSTTGLFAFALPIVIYLQVVNDRATGIAEQLP